MAHVTSVVVMGVAVVTEPYFNQPTSDQPLFCSNLEQFIHELQDMFGDRDQHQIAVQKLKRLIQTRSVSEYYARFLAISADVEYEDRSLRDMFEAGLRLSRRWVRTVTPMGTSGCRGTWRSTDKASLWLVKQDDLLWYWGNCGSWVRTNRVTIEGKKE